MLQVRSLDRRLMLQFIAVILPATVVLAWQTAADQRRATALEHAFATAALADEARAAYKTFVNGTVDAVDSGKLSKSAIDALGSAAERVQKLRRTEDTPEVAKLDAALGELVTAIGHDAALPALLPLKPKINAGDQGTAALANDHAKAAHAVVLDNAQSAHLQTRIVCGALLVTLIITALLIRALTRGLTAPLGVAVETARRISDGQIDRQLQFGNVRDVGSLLSSLQEMNGQLHAIISAVQSSSHSTGESVRELLNEAGGLAGAARAQTHSVATAKEVLEQMNGALQNAVADANAAAAAASDARGVAQRSDQNMRESLNATRGIVSRMTDATDSVGTLSQSMSRIGQVTRLINEVAEQTNLLALNAAIEAARAGVHGRGFAVVADEVRKLAERTSASTAEISRIVIDARAATTNVVDAMGVVQGEVERSAQLASSTANLLRDIVSAAERAAESAQAISASATQQAQAGSLALEQMQRIAEASQETLQLAEEINRTAGSLEVGASRLTSVVGKFRLS
jgi:methyl-accepting chemotaxis protein